MERACIAIVDAAHARLYAYEARDEAEPRLHEEVDLVSAGRQAHGKFTDTKPGNRWQEGGRGSTDDHRNDYIAGRDQKFAKLVAEEVMRLLTTRNLRRLILVASPKMLGMLRTVQGPLQNHGVRIDEVAQDLAWMTSAQLHDHLAAMSLIAPRARVALRG